MSENVASVTTMQADHRAWSDARVHWRCEMQQWQREHDAAVARLAELQKLIHVHGEALTDYAKTLNDADKIAADHDRQMAEYAAGKSQVPQDVLANRHQEQVQRFAHQREAHDRIKKHHEGVLAQLRQLEAAATSSM